MSGDVKIKKVKPYPFTSTIDLGTAKIKIEVLLLNERGFLAHVPTGIFSVGKICPCLLELPVFNREYQCNVRVIKTYDKAVEGKDPKDRKVERMVEFHFDNPNNQLASAIFQFKVAIGQK